jgi:outer membrane usher protein FimD/PapC
MSERQTIYTVDVDGAGFVRIVITTQRGQVVHFVVEFEALIDGQHVPVVRYDTAHGRAHRDRLDWQGRVVRKTWLDLNHAEALTWAQDDIMRNWQRYLTAFLRMKP